MRVQLSFFTINWQNHQKTPQLKIQEILEKENVAYKDLISGIELDSGNTATLAILARCHEELSIHADDVVFYINITKENTGIPKLPTKVANWPRFTDQAQK